MHFGSDDYKIADLTVEFRWAEQLIPALVQAYLEELKSGRRAASGSGTVYMGADTTLFQETYYGGTGGTSFSTTLSERVLNAKFESGANISGLSGSTVAPYGFRIVAPKTVLLTYPLEKSGDDPASAALGFQVAKDSVSPRLVLYNEYAHEYYD
jgi:hypothetical protein